MDIRWKLTTARFFDAYRRRCAFHTPWVVPHHVMTNEAIATIWHPPSATVMAPGLERIASTKSEPPPNLPK